jgi:hypothetical protein
VTRHSEVGVCSFGCLERRVVCEGGEVDGKLQSFIHSVSPQRATMWMINFRLVGPRG